MGTKALLDSEPESNEWILTYADLMTLLLVFFILLFSMSTLENEKFTDAVRSLNMALEGAKGANSVINMEHEAPVKPEIPQESEEVLPADNLARSESELPNEAAMDSQNVAIDAEWQRLTDELESKFQIANATNAVEMGQPKDGKLVIRVKGSALFPSGEAEFHPQMMPMLDGIVQVMRKNPQYKVNIQGHTDNLPIRTLQFPSNWELSAVRATTVLRYFVRGGVQPTRVTATGYGDAIPLVVNNNLENRAKNRRIEFVLEKSE